MKLQVTIGVLLLSAASCLAYKAVVVDMTPTTDDLPDVTLLRNTKEYTNRFSSGIDIIVFPEYGLTTLDVLNKTNYKDYAIVVPDVSEDELCNGNITAHKVLTDIACGAKEYGLYAVINLLEKDKSDESIIYNTNVVFGKKGQIVAKYRKINLCGAESDRFRAGSKLVTFKTDFDVTFGTFTCCDILHKFPSLDILEKREVTDIVYTAAWVSKTPFTAALSLQDGYAKKNGVNLLAANYNKPSKSNGGSGIYSALRRESNTYINSVDGNSPVSFEVEKIVSRTPEQFCLREILPTETTRGLGHKPTIQSFKLSSIIEDELKFFNVSELKETTFHETRCSNDGNICCSFDGALKADLHDLKYMFMAYSNNHAGCAIVACNGTDVKTCGSISSNSNSIVFQTITVSVTSSRIGMELYQPTTLRNTLEPSYYSYCAYSDHVEIRGENVRSIVSFGVYSVSNASYMQYNLMLLAVCMGFIKYFVN